MPFLRCPSCLQTTDAESGLHICGALGGLKAHSVKVVHPDDKPDGRHQVIEREDYVGQKGVSPIMAVNTERGDGSNDRVVFAPLAVGFAGAERAMIGAGISPHTARASGQGHNSSHHQFHDHKLERMARIAHQLGSEMAWATSNVNAKFVEQMGANVVKPSTDSFKVALFNNGVTPVDSTTAANTQFGGGTWTTGPGNEVPVGSGYSTGGLALPATVSFTQSATTTPGSCPVTFSTTTTTLTWTSPATITNAYGCLVYDVTATGAGANLAISWIFFGGANTVTAGTFTITWNASGICTVTC